MNASDLLFELARQQIHIVVEGCNLKVTPIQDKTIPPDLLQKLKDNKQELIAQLKANAYCEPPPITPASREGNIPLSFAQQRLWFINQFEEGYDTNYNLPWALRLAGNLDIPALQRTFLTIIDRHESLRTTFQAIEGKGIQVIANQITVYIPVINIRENEVDTYIQNNASHVFDLTTGPLITLRLLKLAAEEYILLINMHHIISDGWSCGVFVKEMTTLYRSYVKGETSPLPQLPIQYIDFSIWQRDWLKGEVLEQHAKYWKKQLRGAPTLLELPTDYPRPKKQMYQGSTEKFKITKDLSDQLLALARKEKVTLTMLIMAAFQLLLSRYSGQMDISVGTPIANRKKLELADLIGFFVNTLVIRTLVDHQLSFKGLLKQVKATMLAAFRHQDFPFEKVIEDINPKRSLSHSPLFQVTLALGNIGSEPLTLDNINILPIESDIKTTQFDLSLFLSETDSGVSGGIIYDTSLFNINTIKRFIQHYLFLLEGIVENPELKLFNLPILSLSEKQQYLYDWNNTKVDHPQDKCIHELFEEQVTRTTRNIAIVYNCSSLSYQELNKKSNQLAHFLIAQGIQYDDLVGICIDRSIEMVIGLLGILKSGAAYLPIDPQHPKDRISYLIEDSSIHLLLTQSNIIENLPISKNVNYFCLDKKQSYIDSYGQVDPKVFIKPHNLAYAIFTSGSTGKPKGTLIEHLSFVNHMLWMRYNFQIGTHDKILAKTPLSFDASGWEWTLPLLTGGQLILAKPDGHTEPDYLLNLVDKNQITVLQVVPTLLNLLLSSPNLLKIKSLKYLFCGGESLPLALLNKLKEHRLDSILCNLYGPTEVTIDSTYWIPPKKDLPNTVSIGRPIDNIKTYILDSHLNPVPLGVIGELFISGKGLARGYLNRISMTAERFIPNPYSLIANERMYKTGDLSRYLPNGNIEFINRIDDQVKIRGLRIELGEIQSQLILSSIVQDSTVSIIEDALGNRSISAYIVPKFNSKLLYHLTKNEQNLLFSNIKKRNNYLAALQDYLHKKLPIYMIPATYVILEKLPLLPNGKIDRKSLPKPEHNNFIKSKYTPPNTDKEKSLVDIWAYFLKLPPSEIGIHDNFFNLGGNSLLIIAIIDKIRKKLNIKFNIKDFYNEGSIKNLIEYSYRKENKDKTVDLSEAELDNDILPCNNTSNHSHPKSILLTGCTGFIGKFLLTELLNKTKATIYCLMRADTEEKGFKLLKNKLTKWKLWNNQYKDRIVVIKGDLALPFLGINNKTYNSISQKIDMIFHNATYMNHLDTYETMKNVNVTGLKNIIKFACINRQKIIQYISTTGVFTKSEYNSKHIDEDSSINSQMHYKSNGYNATKWVAEKIIMNAQKRGIPGNIYRLSLVTGDTILGRCDKNQWFTRLLKIYTTLGCGFDDGDTKWLSITPVDYAVQSIVGLALNKPNNNIFHITNPELTSLKEIVNHYNSAVEKPLKILNYCDFMKQFKEFIEKDNSLPFVPFIHSNLNDFEENPFIITKPLIINSEKTFGYLSKINIKHPPINSILIKKYFGNLT